MASDSDDGSIPDLVEEPDAPRGADDDNGNEMEEPEVVELFPGEAELSALECKNAGNELHKAGKFNDAILRYTAAVQKDPAAAMYRNNRAAAHMMLQDFNAALTDALKAIEIEPQTVKYLERAARCFTALGRNSDATRVYEKIRVIDPDNAAAQNEVGQMHAAKQLEDQASSAVAAGHYNSALSFCDRVLQITPGNDRVKLIKAEAFIKSKKIGDAERIVTAILRKDSNATDALYLRGLCMFDLGDIDRALDHFKRALRGNPDHTKSRESLKTVKNIAKLKEEGKTAWSEARYQEAADRYTEAIEAASDNDAVTSKLFYNRALARSKLKQYHEAIDDCSSALERDQSYVKALIKRSKLKIEVEEFDDAVRDCEAALEMNPNDRDLKQALRDAKLELKKSKRKNYYKILKVEKDADDRTIKKAYRKQAMKYHPDRVQGEEEKANAEVRFKDVGEAYAVLSDSQKRHRYDQGADIEDIQSGGHSGGGHDHHDMFAQMFAQGGFGGGFPGGGGFHFG